MRAIGIHAVISFDKHRPPGPRQGLAGLMGSLLDELRVDHGTGKACSVCSWLETRSEAERADWQTAFDDKSIHNPAIHRAMKARGFAFTEAPVGSHRRLDH